MDSELDDLLSDDDTLDNLDFTNHSGCAQALAEKLADIFPSHPPPRKPKRYKEEYGELIINLARLEGAPFIACLAEVGLSVKQASDWVEKYPHFADCKERAEVEAIRFWHKVGVLGACGKIPKFNSDVWKLYMKNLAKFSDKVDIKAQVEAMVVTCSIGDDGTMNKDEFTDGEALALLNAAIAQQDEVLKKVDGEVVNAECDS